MRKICQILLIGLLSQAFEVRAQEHAAPSMHLTYDFPSGDAVLKMQKIKIVQSAYASFFEVNWFTNGYTGLQQTPDTAYGNANILISSLWDVNTTAGIYSTVNYRDSTTDTSRFGGEGDGWKTINPYGWQLNTWYNLVNRSWKSAGQLFIGTFINDLSTGKWLHSATLSIPDPNKYLEATNDAFLENWDGTDTAWDGRFVRKAFFKDCWNLDTTGAWEKNTGAYFSANNSLADSLRNGIYHNSFNAYFDSLEDAYCMQHGGNTTPSAAFNGGRTLNLPAQSNQGTTPVLTVGAITSISASHSNGTTTVSWTTDTYRSPQLAAQVELIDSFGNVLKTVLDTLPERRNCLIYQVLPYGNYTARVTIRDIFNQWSQPVTTSFTVSGPLPVALISFKGQLRGVYADLQWQTNEAAPILQFQVQRSMDGTDFSTVHIQPAAVGTPPTHLYHYSDPLSAYDAATVYYRLRIVDAGGYVAFSPLVAIRWSVDRDRVEVSPNPASGTLTIQGHNLARALLVDALGRPILQQTLANSGSTISVSSLAKGTYTLLITAVDGRVQTERLVIE